MVKLLCNYVKLMLIMLSQLLYACYIHLGDILEILLPVETAIPTIKKGVVIAMTFGVSFSNCKMKFLDYHSK